MSRTATVASPLVGDSDAPPFSHFNAAGRAPALIVCDHASRIIPASLQDLGLPRSALERHIAWDIGAADLARSLALRLDAPAVLAGFSRLVIDCNRRLDDPTLIVAESDGQAIPGNIGLSAAARAERVRACHAPYHEAVAGRLAAFARAGVVPAVISIHSFTPVFGGTARPWHVGVLWDTDGRMAKPMLAALRVLPELCVGDNLPYSGRHPADYTVDRHAESVGLPHLCLEVRQDLLATAEGVERWSEIIAGPARNLINDKELHQPLHA
ncbi:MAG TPA: N-formylglutamate amidohydrolase [Steroidobacteraceae bacterium]|nr:N-formylglutamate amidohydrolase [Steroidobacteraceae bacterium]